MDRSSLRQMTENLSEPYIFRIAAAYTLAVLAWDVGKWDKAAAWHRDGLVWTGQMPLSERRSASTCEGAADLNSFVDSTVSAMAIEWRASMLEHLGQLEDVQISEPRDPCNWTSLDGSAIPPTVRLRPELHGAAPVGKNEVPIVVQYLIVLYTVRLVVVWQFQIPTMTPVDELPLFVGVNDIGRMDVKSRLIFRKFDYPVWQIYSVCAFFTRIVDDVVSFPHFCV